MRPRLTEREVALMAHALGWPDAYQIRARKGVMRRSWLKNLREPYRNGFGAGDRDLPVWEGLVKKGLAYRSRSEGTFPVFHVTEMGQERTKAFLAIVRQQARSGYTDPQE